MMTRLGIAALVLVGACSSAPPPESASAPTLPAAEDEPAAHVALPSADQIAARELNADEQVKQAIERLTWGPRPGLYDTVRAMGVDRWVYQQLEPARIHDPAADQFVAQFPLLTTSIPSLLSEIPTPGQEKKAAGAAPTAADSAAMKKEAERSRKLLTDLQAAKVGRALISERQLDEVMVDFWFNHFNVFAGKGPERYYLPAYERDGDPSICARQIPQPARRGGAESGDALLSGQLGEPSERERTDTRGGACGGRRRWRALRRQATRRRRRLPGRRGRRTARRDGWRSARRRNGGASARGRARRRFDAARRGARSQ